MVKSPTDQIVGVERRLVNTITKIATDTGAYNSYRLVDYPSQSEFGSLFNQYKITKVEVKFILVGAPNNNAMFPTLYIAPQDYQTTGVPSSRDEVLQFQGAKTHQFGPSNLVFTMSRVPTITRDIGNQVSGGEIAPAQWLNAINTSNQHLGFVWWLSRYNSVSDNTHTLDIEYSITISAKRTR